MKMYYNNVETSHDQMDELNEICIRNENENPNEVFKKNYNNFDALLESNKKKDKIMKTKKNSKKERKQTDRNSVVPRNTYQTFAIYNNGLIESNDYYFTLLKYKDNDGQFTEKFYTVGFYSRNNLFSQRVLLFSSAFQTLRSTNYVDGDVIDANCILNERNWINTIFVPTQQTNALFNRHRELTAQYVGDDWMMLKISFPRNGKILMPVLRPNIQHWVILMFDIDKKTISYIDPFERTREYLIENTRILFSKFVAYINICKQKQITNVFTENNWTVDWYLKSRPYQRDGHSCGPFITYIMDIIGKNETFDLSFNPINYRVEMAKSLLKESEDMKNFCQFCFNERHFESVTCSVCNRFSHLRCSPRVNYETAENICVLCYAYFYTNEKEFHINS